MNQIKMNWKDYIQLLWYNLKLKIGYQSDTTSRHLLAFWKKHSQDEAIIQAYHKAITFYPKDERLLLEFADFLRERKQDAEAISLYRQVIAINDSIFLAHRNLGNLLLKQQQWQDAELAYRRAIKLLNKPSIFLYRKLGTTLAQQQRWIEAINAYQLGWNAESDICRNLLICKTEIEQGRDTWETYKFLFQTLGQVKQWSGAIAAWWTALKCNPKEDWWRNERCLNLSKKYNKLNELQTYLGEQFEQNPGELTIGLNLSVILEFQNQSNLVQKVHKTIAIHKLQEYHPNLKSQTRLLESQPDFTIIGAQKSGTSSLYYYLEEHPKISVSIKKELHFWSLNYNKGKDWYLSHFLPIPEGETWVTGEASPTYLDSPKAAERMYREFPNMKLIVLLRNPVTRAISHYHHWLRLRKEFRPLETALSEQLDAIPNWDDIIAIRNHYIARGCYVEFLKKWLDLFPRQNILVIPSEQFQAHRSNKVQDVHSFLGIPRKPLEDSDYYNVGDYQFSNQTLKTQLENFYAPYNQALEELLEQSFDWTIKE